MSGFESKSGRSGPVCLRRPDSTESPKESAKLQDCSGRRSLYKYATLQARMIADGRCTSKGMPYGEALKACIPQAKNTPIGGFAITEGSPTSRKTPYEEALQTGNSTSEEHLTRKLDSPNEDDHRREFYKQTIQYKEAVQAGNSTSRERSNRRLYEQRTSHMWFYKQETAHGRLCLKQRTSS